jgi:galactonate dehydratase
VLEARLQVPDVPGLDAEADEAECAKPPFAPESLPVRNAALAAGTIADPMGSTPGRAGASVDYRRI